MTGAGISVAAGIPDWRSPGTGIFSRIGEMLGEEIDPPELLFDLNYFMMEPKFYYAYRKVLLKHFNLDTIQPTYTHHFITRLHTQGLLHKCFTQNTDSLHSKANLPPSKLVEAHGNNESAMCPVCKTTFDKATFLQACAAGTPVHCDYCGAPIKPTVIFFNEQMPKDFFQEVRVEKLREVDLLLILGTSLKVGPFNQIPYYLDPNVP